MKIVQSLQVKNIYPLARIITKVYKNSKNKTQLKIYIGSTKIFSSTFIFFIQRNKQTFSKERENI